MSEHLNEKFLEYLKYMNTTMKADIADGHQWKYCNVTSKKAKGFEAARKAKKYLINCVDGVTWALKACGVPGSSLNWYGSDGKIAWLNSSAKANAKKYFEIISTGGKTVKKLHDTGQLCDGDILIGYQGMSHTNVYYGNDKSFDSGHAYATGSGEGAKFKKWIGALAHSSKKVNYILRIKDRTHYRVQCGAFTDIGVFNDTMAQLKAAGYGAVQIVEDGMYKIQAGYFSGETNAKKLANEIKGKGFSAIVKEVD